MTKKKIIGIKKVMKVSRKIIPNVKKELNLDLKMELFTKANGKEMSVMVMESKSGQMVLNMRAIGKIIRLMDKVYFGMFMVTNMKGGGNEIKPMVMVNIPTVMELLTKVTGKTTSSTVKE